MTAKPADGPSNPPMPNEPWLRHYRREQTGSYDELLLPSGEPRPAWRKLVAMLGAMGQPELRRRWDNARLLLHEHGVSYDAYGDPQGVTRPWSLSPIPVVVASDEWSKVAEGLAQRALLLSRILADLYGSERLLTDGDLPPEIVFAHPGFLRACVGIVPAGPQYLPLYAADLARREDGTFIVLADRTGAPSGAGYALENRIVLSRSLPEVFRECNVERLAVFFRTVKDALKQLAPNHRDNPQIVLLTPGPYNATYFEQAFLAQYLGLTLVQGGDLTVRDTRVYLKTLGGLQMVDVILRRLNDDFCDPLELRSESTLGVPGLVEAVRSGNVALANPLGSSVLQTPAILPFLPALCRKLLGEELKLASVPTYWCGDPASLAYVEAHLPELVIRPAFPVGTTEPVFARALSARALEELRARLQADPRSYVAQDTIVLSSAPTLMGDELVPAHLWMRAYLVATGERYEVMPGALSRVGGPDESLALSLRPGGESKDTWILSGGPVSTFSLLPSDSAPATLSRGGGDLPSRVADNLFWLGRYAERAEGTARLARAIGARLSDQNGGSEPELTPDLDALFSVLEARTQVPHPSRPAKDVEGKGRGGWLAAAERSLLASVVDGDPLESLRMTMAAAYGAARTVRDRIAGDTWRVLAQIDQEVRKAPGITGPSTVGALMNLLDRIVTALAAVSGLAMDSMSRGQAWRFLDAGRRLERGLHIVSLLRHALGVPRPHDGPLLEALLEIADSSMTYRRRYRATLQVAPVVDLLLTDETNPRSVLFQFAALSDHIDALPREPRLPRTPQQKLVLSATSELRLAEVTAISEPNERGERPHLVALLERLTALFPELSNSLTGAYLNHAVVSRQLQGGA